MVQPPQAYKPPTRSKKVAVKLSPEELLFLDELSQFFGWKWSDSLRNSLALMKAWLHKTTPMPLEGSPAAGENPKRILAFIQAHYVEEAGH